MNKIKLKTNLETESIFNSKLINNSANNPKNSLLSNFYLDTKFSVKLKKEEKTNYSSVITEKNTIEKKQDYNEIEKQLTDKIFKNLTMETKNNEKPIEIIVSDERKKFKRNERRELSAMTDDFSQNSNIDENLKYDNSNVDKPPSLFKRKSGKNQSKKLNLSEEDFNKINSKTIIKEKLQYCYFNEKKEQVGIADEELIMSTSKSEMEDKKERNNNEFLMVFDQKKNRKPSNFNSNENKIQFDNDNNSNNIYKEIMKDLERDDFMIGSVMVNSKKKAYKK